MNEISREKLSIYIDNANSSISHPCDEEKFVDFVITSHKTNDISVDIVEELEEILSDNHFTDEMIRSLVVSYEFGRLLLSKL